MNFFGLIDIPVWILLISFILSLAIVYITSTHGMLRAAGVPGPPPGIFGVVNEYNKKGVGQTDLDLVKKYGRLVGIYHVRLPILLVADVNIVKEICVKEFPRFTNRVVLLPNDEVNQLSVGNARDEDWKFTRSLLSSSFSSGKIKKMIPLIESCSHILIKHLKNKAETGEEFEMKRFMSSFTLDVICSVAFGIDIDSQNDPNNPYVRNALKAINISFRSPVMILCFLFPFMKDIFQKLGMTFLDRNSQNFFVEETSKVIKEKIQDPKKRDDILQLMINVKEESQQNESYSVGGVHKVFTDLHIISNSITFLIAGFETTSNTLSFISHLLATNPELQDKMIQELDYFVGEGEITNDNLFKLHYMDRFISETLRMYPPAIRSNREASEDIEIGGYKLPRGTEINVAIYAIHHDPEYWNDPETFDPDRFLPDRMGPNPPCFMPFGLGPRNCIGMRLALTEMKVSLVSILRHYRFVTSPSTQIPLVLAKNEVMLQSEKGIWLKIEAR
ncbi:cytochrome P450 3A6 [Patella vulgata]|uniref:cytochrome P450 3A6 n=1 Tax=Patella vulgata TaxID=6465 RepID=UPI002180774A|nr:cytochrome P450 3A6 [Patella vulgata]